MDAANLAVLAAYLDRIGVDHQEAKAMIERRRKPNYSELRLLLQRHIMTVPFENLGQHDHPGHGDDGKRGAEVLRCPARNPSLHTHETLKKIVFERRGGFCWEINVAFAWLLKALGYRVRFGNANVIKPKGPPIPGHLCLFVDGLLKGPFLVDPGFGDAPRVPIPLNFGTKVTDSMIGDEYCVISNDGSKYDQTKDQRKRFNGVLMRSRCRGLANSPMVDFAGMERPPISNEMTPPEPIYLFNGKDDCEMDCAEFKNGLSSVLRKDKENPFSQKRLCFLATQKGYKFQGEEYFKVVEFGKEISRAELKSELAYRDSLFEHFNVTLR